MKIELLPSLLIGKGLHRECFSHPQNENLCIKVVVNGNQRETIREQTYYKFLQNRNIEWNHLPKFYGNIVTSIGEGAVFDIIRDDSGDISKSLKHYLNSEYELPLIKDDLVKALNEFKHDLLAQNIITMSIKPQNLLYQRLGRNGRIYLVDNIGNSDLFPISSYSRFFGKRKILRKWNNFRHFIDSKHYHPLIEQIINSI